ncbi:metal tolerance protein C2-like isoform X1 [Glycine soja]|uniref:metal tolerance protein C2-like isoform X1 n=1 Tax=Glycine soja TaxID=3848 RepID=UPI00103AA79E|nr:metal tolerance protein C2-like isoform X1 [Glycine soja]
MDSLSSINGDFGFDGGTDRRFAFSRQASFQQPHTPIDIPAHGHYDHHHYWSPRDDKPSAASLQRSSLSSFVFSVFRSVRSGHRYMKRLFLMISLNVAYSTAELLTGLFTGRVGLVSDAVHLTFGCGLLTFSLFVMAASRKKADREYTYGYKRLEVLSAFTNALFLLFMSFSLAVEALHAFIQDESEHKHYLIVSAVTNLFVNLVGVWFFRNYARINLISSGICLAAYRNAEDMNNHSVFLHVVADSIRSAGLILASWLLSIGVQNAEVLCLGLVSVAVFMLVLPLFRATGGILLQMAPPSIPTTALNKCLRQISSREDVMEVSLARFWELLPGHVFGSLIVQVKKGTNDRPILEFVHGLFHDLGVQDLTVQTDDA